MEQFGPLRLEAEGELYNRQLAVAHELEALEARVIALRGGTLCDEAKNLGFDFGLSAQVRQNLRAMPGVRRANSGSSSSVPMRYASSLSQRDSEMSMMDVPRSSSQTVVTLANGAASGGSPRGASKPDLGFVISPRSTSPKEMPAAAQIGDSSPVRRLQAGQRVVLPNGLVAVAMPATVPAGTAQAPMVATPGTVTPGVPQSPSRSHSQVLGPIDGSPQAKPSLRTMGSATLQGELTPSQRLQLASLQAESPRHGQSAGSCQVQVESPRRQLQSMASMTSQGAESPRRQLQSMGSMTGQGVESPRPQLQSLGSMTSQNVESPRRQVQTAATGSTSQGADSPRRPLQSMASMTTQGDLPREDVQQSVSIQTATSAEVATPQSGQVNAADGEVSLSLVDRLQSLKEKTDGSARAPVEEQPPPVLVPDTMRQMVQSQPMLVPTPSTTSIRSAGATFATPSMPRPAMAPVTMPATVPMAGLPVSMMPMQRPMAPMQAARPFAGMPPQVPGAAYPMSPRLVGPTASPNPVVMRPMMPQPTMPMPVRPM